MADKTDLRTAAYRLLCHQIRLSILAQSDVPAVVNSLTGHGDRVATKWFQEVGKLNLTDAWKRAEVSKVLHEEMEAAIRDTRMSFGSTPSVFRGLAEFQKSFNADALIPKGDA